jgi:Transposase DDE domain group 1
MTDCNRQPLQFSTLSNKAVIADFLGGRLTTDADALLLREVAEKIGLFDVLNAVISDPRNPVFTIHDQHSMLAQRVIAIALGYEDLNDHQALRTDPAL